MYIKSLTLLDLVTKITHYVIDIIFSDGSHPPTSTDASDVSRLRSLTGDLHTESVVRNRHALDTPHRTALTQSASTDCIPNATSTDISNYSPNNPRALQRKIGKCVVKYD